MSKEILLQTAASMPAEYELDDFLEQLVVREKIEQGLKSLREGKGIPHEEAMAMIRAKMKARRDAYEQGRDNLVS